MKKARALILIATMMAFLTSCHSYVCISNKQDFETYQDKEHIYVLDLITNKDSIVYFSSSFPGKLSNCTVTGPRHVLLQSFESDSVVYDKSKLHVSYVYKHNNKYIVRYRNDTALICIKTDTTRINFSEIKQMHVKKRDPGKTAILLVWLAGAAIPLFISLANMAVNAIFSS